MVCLCRSWSSICIWETVSADHDHPFVPEGLSLQITIIHLQLRFSLRISWSSICTWGPVSAGNDSLFVPDGLSLQIMIILCTWESVCKSWSSIYAWRSVSEDHDHQFVLEGLQIMVICLYLRVCLYRTWSSVFTGNSPCRSWSSICNWGPVSADHDNPFVTDGLCLQIMIIHLYLRVSLCRSW